MHFLYLPFGYTFACSILPRLLEIPGGGHLICPLIHFAHQWYLHFPVLSLSALSPRGFWFYNPLHRCYRRLKKTFPLPSRSKKNLPILTTGLLLPWSFPNVTVILVFVITFPLCLCSRFSSYYPFFLCPRFPALVCFSIFMPISFSFNALMSETEGSLIYGG